jgi:hypothetical protein
MLSKEVCKKCIEMSAGKLACGDIALMDKVCRFKGWGVDDDVAWSHGIVRCRFDDRIKGFLLTDAAEESRATRIFFGTPDWCPFETEHVIAQENQSAEQRDL